jgi:carbamoyltransferase
MEFGPRALGHRSILARPIDKAINDQLNERLRRTEFMPFAPSILAEYSNLYFQNYAEDHVASEYMTITYDVNDAFKQKIPAVVHVDGTARPQVVHRQKEPAYHKIISEYHKLSGIPLIINTSFNMHEEPIVCTPQDAIRSYKANCVDVLVMDHLVTGADKLTG